MSTLGWLVFSTAGILTLAGLIQLVMVSQRQKSLPRREVYKKSLNTVVALVDPTMERLNTEGIFPRPIILLMQDGTQVGCTADLKDGHNVVYFHDEPTRPVVWAKRKVNAGKKIESGITVN